MKKIASILLFSLLFWGCKKPTGFEYRGINNIKLSQVSGDSTAISATLSFFNPNNYSVQLKKIDADIFANNQFLTHYTIDTLIIIRAKSVFDYPAFISFDTNKILTNMLSALFNRNMLLHIKGKTRVGKAGFFVNIPFDFTSKQDFHF